MAMPAPIPEPNPQNRRRHPRRASAAIATLFVPNENKPGQTVQMLDLSLHGVGFRSPTPLAFGAMYGLQLSENWLNLTARIRVLTSRPHSSGHHDIGAHFA